MTTLQDIAIKPVTNCYGQEQFELVYKTGIIKGKSASSETFSSYQDAKEYALRLEGYYEHGGALDSF